MNERLGARRACRVRREHFVRIHVRVACRVDPNMLTYCAANQIDSRSKHKTFKIWAITEEI